MSNSFGELVLVLGDVHIPSRATKIPAAFQRMLVPNKMQHIVATGNVSAETYRELCALAPNVHVSKGDWDTENFPESVVLQVGAFRVGVVHQVVPDTTDGKSILRRKLNVDILISGHTHQHDVTVHEDRYYFINPVRDQSSFWRASKQMILIPSHGRVRSRARIRPLHVRQRHHHLCSWQCKAPKRRATCTSSTTSRRSKSPRRILPSKRAVTEPIMLY